MLYLIRLMVLLQSPLWYHLFNFSHLACYVILAYIKLSFMVFLPVWVQSVADVAEDVWDRYGFDFGTDYSGLFKALSHVNYNVRSAAAEALAAALDENPDTIQVVIN